MNKLLFPLKDLVGQKFGKLTVMKFLEFKETGKKNKTGSNYRLSLWLCKCDCGQDKVISTNRLHNGQRSCGCALKEYRIWAKTHFKPKNMLPTGEAAFNLLYLNYKVRARKKNILFSLTKDEFKDLTKQKCYYCGQEPLQSAIGNKKRGANGDYLFNGIDRKDNNLGYTINNSITCCGICNKAKRDLSFNMFVQWIQKLSKYATQINFRYSL